MIWLRRHLWLSLLIVLLLVSCVDDETREPRRTASDRATNTAPPTTTVVPSPTASPTVPPTVTPTPTPPAPLAAIVNGQYVFLEDYERQASQYEQMLLASGLDPEGEDGQKQLEQVRHEVLESLIDAVLIEEGASDLGIRLSEEFVAQQLAADVAAGGGPEAFEEWLAATGQTAEDYRMVLRRTMLVERIWKAIAAEALETTEQDLFELWLEELRAAAVVKRFVSD